MNSLNVRPAKEDEIEIISAISIEVWLDTYALEGVISEYARYVTKKYSIEALYRQLNNDKYMFLISANQYGVQGYLKLNYDAEPVTQSGANVEIETLYVRRHHHRQGHGRALFEAAMARVKNAGNKEVFLTVNSENKRAILFYDSLGLQRSGSWTFEFEGVSVPNLVLTAFTDEFDGQGRCRNSKYSAGGRRFGAEG